MAGILYHAIKFLRDEPYVGRDGRQHYEVALIDGDYCSMTMDTWNRITEAAHAAGIPRTLWPEYESGIDGGVALSKSF